MMPLSYANLNESNTIQRVSGKPEIKRHLENLGFIPGTAVSIVNRLNGNVIVNVKDVRVALSEELARKIMI